jgi:hypothetical protein
MKSKTAKRTTAKRTIKRNKTAKRTNKKPCDEFCRNEYVNEIDKQNREIIGSAYSPTEADRNFRISTCKNNFCNTDCKTKYKYNAEENKQLFTKKMKNNFITNMKPKLIKTMKTKGATSYCDGFVHNPFNRK